MRPRTARLALLLAAAALLPGGAGRARAQDRYNTEAYRQVTGALTCQCGGCNAIVSECAMDRCPSSNPIREETAERLRAGETPEEVVADFRDRYGLAVLAAPPAAGFHLAAWVLPGLFLMLGGAAAAFVIRSWRRETPARPKAGTDAAPGADGEPGRPEVIARIEREVSELR